MIFQAMVKSVKLHNYYMYNKFSLLINKNQYKIYEVKILKKKGHK